MKDIIILEKIREEEELSENIVDIIILVKVTQVSSFVDFILKYK